MSQPLVGSYEGHVLSVTGSETQVSLKRRWMEEASPAREHLLLDPTPQLCPSHNVVYELFPCQAASVESIPDLCGSPVYLIEIDLVELQPRVVSVSETSL